MTDYLVLAVFFALFGCSTKGPLVSTPKADSYLWLEEVEGEKALSWVRDQNAKTLETLEKNSSYNSYLLAAKKTLTSHQRIPYGRIRKGYVYNFWQDKKNVRGLWRRTSLSQYKKKKPKWEILLDIDQLAKEEGENWVYKRVNCLPPEYNRCLLFLSRGGKDAFVVREFNIKKKDFVTNGFEVPEAKTFLSWYDKNTLLIGTDWGPKSLTNAGYPMEQRLWKRGGSLKEAQLIFKGAKTDVGVGAVRVFRPEGQSVIVSRSLTSFEREYFYMKPNLEMVAIPVPKDAEIHGLFKGEILVQTKSPWKTHDRARRYTMVQAGSLVSFSAAQFLRSKTIEEIKEIFVPSKRTSFQSLSTSKNAVFFSVLDNVKGKVYRAKLRAGRRWHVQPVKVPANGSTRVISADDFAKDVLISYQSYTIPNRLYLSQGGTRFPQVIRSLPEQFNARNLQVQQLEATSKDGTKIPYFVVAPKNIRYDGSNKTLLYGYGGFEASLTPYYMGVTGKLWLEPGNVYVVANIRGGGEFGPSWHQAAQKQRRQIAFDDFIAVAEDLVRRKITSPQKLGMMGGSNGGLLVAAVFVQRPELFGAMVCRAPLLDMMRYPQLLAGATWIGEYGDPTDPKMRKALKAYSPYHNVKKKLQYPKAFFITSTKDDRVHPGHARKMVAKMKDQGHPVFYYENIEGGHRLATNLLQRAKISSLEFVYLKQMLSAKVQRTGGMQKQ